MPAERIAAAATPTSASAAARHGGTGPVPSYLTAAAIVQIAAAGLVAVMAAGAFLVDLPVVAHGAAHVVPSLPIQPIEPVNGGRVSELHVKEGDHVKAGDTIAEVVNLDIKSTLAERKVERAVLAVKAARLAAEADDRPFKPDPDAPEDAARREKQLWLSRSASRDADRTALQSQKARAIAERKEILAKLESARRLATLSEKRHDFMAANSHATVVQMMDLERDVAEHQGTVSELEASALRAASQVEEVDTKLAAQEATWRRDILSDLADTQAKIDVIRENERAAAARLDESALKTPVRGIVQTVYAGPGRVVAPGNPVVDIVPLTDRLLVEARIPPSEVAGLRPGLRAVVRLDALDYRTYGALEGEVITMSPDAIKDPDTGTLYYRVRVATTLKPDQQNLDVIPGMTGTVDIELGRRRVAAYLFKPVQRVLDRAFRE